MSDEQIRVKIRDEYLRESSITIVLFGKETAQRKHVD
ncbi:MAG: TIR domain-containing protein [Vagococcus fluvialis]